MNNIEVSQLVHLKLSYHLILQLSQHFKNIITGPMWDSTHWQMKPPCNSLKLILSEPQRLCYVQKKHKYVKQRTSEDENEYWTALFCRIFNSVVTVLNGFQQAAWAITMVYVDLPIWMNLTIWKQVLGGLTHNVTVSYKKIQNKNCTIGRGNCKL